MQRILVFTHFYAPEPNFITEDVAQALGEKAAVTVVTVHTNYPEGRFPSGTRWWLPKRTVEGRVVVWRLPFFPDHSRSVARRALSYFSALVAKSLFAPFVAGRPDIVWVYEGPFTTGLAALWFKWVRSSRLVFTCADLWPESFVASGVMRDTPLMRLFFAYSAWLHRRADFVICSTRGTLERCRRDGVPLEKLAYVPVWVQGIGEPGPDPDSGAAPRIVYAGNIGPAQKLDTLIRAAALMQARGMGVAVDLYGSGASEEELRTLAARLGAGNVTFHGRVSPEEAFRRSSSAFAQVVSLQPSPLFRMTIPSKLPFAFAAGAPVLFGLQGESAAAAEESGGGVGYDASDPETLVAAVLTLLSRSEAERQRMRRALREYYERNFARETLLDRYRQIVLGERQVSTKQPENLAEKVGT